MNIQPVIIVLSWQVYYTESKKWDGEACSMHGSNKKCVQF